MTGRTGTRALLLGVLLVFSGCATYYRVTVPTSGKTYYTDDVSRQRSGAVSFTDASTGDTVILQASEVQEIGKDQFREGTRGAPIRASAAAEGSKLAVKVGYVSAANSMGAGQGHAADAVYAMQIQGAHLDRDQMYEKGWNGFRYQVDLESPTAEQGARYRAFAYPLAGVRYSEDGEKTASLVPAPVAFQWMGPRPDGSRRTVKVTQLARDFGTGKDVVIGTPVVVELPPAQAAPGDLTRWIIRLEVKNSGAHFNGVSAFPLRVSITDREGKEAPPAVYDRLVFYAKDSGGAVIHDRVVGADPAGSEALAVMPALWGSGEKEMRTPVPRYGETKRGAQAPAGRGLFYVTAGPGKQGEAKVRKLNIQLVNDQGAFAKENDFQLEDRNEKVSGKLEPSNAGPNSETVRTLSLESEGADRAPYLSDPTGGEFDFVVQRAAEGSETPNYLLALLPEGMNERDIRARFNFSKFERGFFLKPVVAGGVVTGFEVSDRTSSLFTTWGKNIFAYVFDVHGRYPSRELFRDDERKAVRKWEEKTEVPISIRWDDAEMARTPEDRWSGRLMVCVDNQSLLPIVFSVRGVVRDQGTGYKNRTHSETSIVSARNTKTCYATGDDTVVNKKTKVEWMVDGRSWMKPGELRFEDKLQAYKHIAGSGGRIAVRATRKYTKNSDARPPFGTDQKVSFAYEGTDSFLTRYLIQYRDWARVHEDKPTVDGADWFKSVLGGTFKGTMNKKGFDLDDWSDTKWEKWADD